MQIHIDKQSEVPARDQLRQQIIFLIGTGQLSKGTELPSVRELARRLKVHHNTISCIYSQLTRDGWLKKRRGSRVVVGQTANSWIEEFADLDDLINRAIRLAGSRGYSLQQLTARVRARLLAEPSDHLLVVAPERDLAELIRAEIGETVGHEPEACSASVVQQNPSIAIGAILITPSYFAGKVQPAVPAERTVVAISYSPAAEHIAAIRNLSQPSVIGVVSVSALFLESPVSSVARVLSFPTEKIFRTVLAIQEKVIVRFFSGRKMRRPHQAMDRRTFVKRTCVSSAALFLGGMDALAYDDEVKIPPPPAIDVREAPLAKRSPLGMPGLYPGRVVELSDHRSIVGNRVSQPIVRQMLERGIRELTGESSARAAWAKFVEPKDVVGIKINPSGAPACCSSPELVREIINAVQSAEVPARNIVVYDRFGYEMDMGGYQVLMPPGIRVLGVQDDRLDASGYDAEIYCQADFFGEWETRSYMASVVARQINKIINVPTLKDHSASGVTGCLKNVGYGTFSNVARSHRAPFSFTNPLIGVMCSVEPLRSKTVLNIMDGTRMVWHGGPLTQNQSFIYQAGILLVSTDPVATDTIELDLIEKKRQQQHAPSVWEAVSFIRTQARTSFTASRGTSRPPASSGSENPI